MDETQFHWLSTGPTKFDYVAVNGEQVELKMNFCTTSFELDTAEEIVAILRGYLEDRQRSRDEFMRAADIVSNKIEEINNG